MCLCIVYIAIFKLYSEHVNITVQELRVLAASRQHVHLREQDSARDRRAHPDHSRCGPGPHPAPDQGPRVPHVGNLEFT